MSGTKQSKNEETPTIRTLDLRRSAADYSNIILIIPESVEQVDLAVTVASIARRNTSLTDHPLKSDIENKEKETTEVSLSDREKQYIRNIAYEEGYQKAYETYRPHPRPSGDNDRNVYAVINNSEESTGYPAALFSTKEQAAEYINNRDNPESWQITMYVVDFAVGK